LEAAHHQNAERLAQTSIGILLHRASRAADHRRDGKLRRQGYRVLRLPAAVVLANVERAVALVRASL
jgi:very-short-patch-repair endonuclease